MITWADWRQERASHHDIEMKMPQNSGYMSVVTILAYSVIVSTYSNGILHSPGMSQHNFPHHSLVSLPRLSCYKSLLLIIVALTSPSSANTVFTQSVSLHHCTEKHNRNPSLFFNYHLLLPSNKTRETKSTE